MLNRVSRRRYGVPEASVAAAAADMHRSGCRLSGGLSAERVALRQTRIEPRGLALPTRSTAARRSAPDLALPDAAETIDQHAAPRMALLKPAGDGPFPAIVLDAPMRRAQSGALLLWARKSVARGYVVLLVDSLGPREVRSVCCRATEWGEFLPRRQGRAAGCGTSAPASLCRRRSRGAGRLLRGAPWSD